jgi:hypothetical protein
VIPPGAEHRFAGHPGVQPLRHAVDEQVGHHELAQIASREGLVLEPEPLGDLAHGRPAQEAPAVTAPEGGLDIPGAQAAGEQLDGQPLELGGPPGQPRPDPRHEGLGAIRDLRHPVLDGAFRRPQPAPPVAIPIPAAGLRPALVVAPAQGVAHLRLQGFLHDLADGQPEQLGPRVTVRHPFLQQRFQPLVCLLGRRYPRLHRGCSSCRRRQPASRVLGPSKSASPIRFPASLGLHRAPH